MCPRSEDWHMAITLEEATTGATRARAIPRLSGVVLSGVVRLIEAVLIVAVGLLVFLFYLGPEAADQLPAYSLVIVGAAQIHVAAFGAAHLYDVPALRRPTLLRAGRVLLFWTCVFAALLVLAFMTKMGAEFSRVWFTTWYAAGFVTLMAFRVVLSRLVDRWTKSGKLERRVVIVGGDERAEKLIDALEASPDTDIRICAIFDDRSDRTPARVRGYPYLGSLTALLEFGRQCRVDMLIVTLPITAESRILNMVKQLFVLPVDIRLSAHSSNLRFAPHSYSFLGNVPMFDVTNRPVKDWGYVLKLVEDRLLASLFLLLALPIFLVVAIAIKLTSSGPVFFKQKRFGFNNELIEVYKFRTLRQDMTDQNAERLVTANDPRVTKVGRFLRRSSIDELPQLITVLKGGMSIVGPRPHATAAKAAKRLYQDVVESYFARHRVKPGITGWAQIHGWRGETDTEEKILRRTEHDLYYIDNWSIWLDLYIIIKTPWSLFKGENAY
jgi:Undecaprenyl-phosphate glucose phosphotransferase